MIKKAHVRLIFLTVAVGWISACSSTNKAYYDTLKLALNQNDINLTVEEVRARKADVLAVKYGDKPQIIMALAFMENDQHKWVSADKAMLIMQSGIVVKTYGLTNDILYNSDSGAIPDYSLATSESQFREYYVDIDQYGYGIPVEAKWHRVRANPLVILGNSFETYVVEEEISFSKISPFYETGLKWMNQYWFSSETGELLKSIQAYSPVDQPMTMIYLSRAQRLLDGVSSQ